MILRGSDKKSAVFQTEWHFSLMVLNIVSFFFCIFYIMTIICHGEVFLSLSALGSKCLLCLDIHLFNEMTPEKSPNRKEETDIQTQRLLKTSAIWGSPC